MIHSVISLRVSRPMGLKDSAAVMSAAYEYGGLTFGSCCCCVIGRVGGK